ncbi:MAG: hypothetical protein LBV38_03635 [Alistipes sp.]|nr:hypothetical protein [Alistipes sp.]
MTKIQGRAAASDKYLIRDNDASGRQSNDASGRQGSDVSARQSVHPVDETHCCSAAWLWWIVGILAVALVVFFVVNSAK